MRQIALEEIHTADPITDSTGVKLSNYQRKSQQKCSPSTFIHVFITLALCAICGFLFNEIQTIKRSNLNGNTNGNSGLTNSHFNISDLNSSSLLTDLNLLNSYFALLNSSLINDISNLENLLAQQVSTIQSSINAINYQ